MSFLCAHVRYRLVRTHWYYSDGLYLPPAYKVWMRYVAASYSRIRQTGLTKVILNLVLYVLVHFCMTRIYQDINVALVYRSLRCFKPCGTFNSFLRIAPPDIAARGSRSCSRTLSGSNSFVVSVCHYHRRRCCCCFLVDKTSCIQQTKLSTVWL